MTEILTGMRLLVAGRSGLAPQTELDHEGLWAAYAPRGERWLRCNMVTSLDGSATGADGRSGSINDDADHVVFELLRATSHVVVVGAGTVRAEGYPPLSVETTWRDLRREHGLPDALPLVAVSNRGTVPPTLRGCRDGSVLLAVPAGASGLTDARADLGDENVLVCGDDALDATELVRALHRRGWRHVLTEGGPSLLGTFLRADIVDELCFTIAPLVVGGEHPRPVGPDGVPADLDLEVLVEQDGTLMGRWLIRR